MIWTSAASASRTGKAAGRITARTRLIGTTTVKPKSGEQHGKSMQTGRWRLPGGRSASTTAAISVRALIKSPLSIWALQPPRWKSAASRQRKETSTVRLPQTISCSKRSRPALLGFTTGLRKKLPSHRPDNPPCRSYGRYSRKWAILLPVPES